MIIFVPSKTQGCPQQFNLITKTCVFCSQRTSFYSCVFYMLDQLFGLSDFSFMKYALPFRLTHFLFEDTMFDLDMTVFNHRFQANEVCDICIQWPDDACFSNTVNKSRLRVSRSISTMLIPMLLVYLCVIIAKDFGHDRPAVTGLLCSLSRLCYACLPRAGRRHFKRHCHKLFAQPNHEHLPSGQYCTLQYHSSVNRFEFVKWHRYS